MILVVTSYIFAGEEKLSIGLGYPYFSVKYHPLELKYATGEGIDIFAGRFYYDFYKKAKTKIFIGLEAGSIKFDALDIKGSGYEGSLFIGGEYFVTRKLSLMLDFAPTFINLNSNNDYEIDGIEMVANFAIYIYFSGKTEGRNSVSGKKIQSYPTVSEAKNLAPSLQQGTTNFLDTQPTETLVVSSSPVHKETIGILKDGLLSPTTNQISMSEESNEQKLTVAEKKALMDGYFDKATQLFQQGKYQESITEWEKVLAIDPNRKLSKQKIERARTLKEDRDKLLK